MTLTSSWILCDIHLTWLTPSGMKPSLKSSKRTPKPPEESRESIIDKPWTRELEGLTPIQSWQHWMNENALRVEMGIPLLPHLKHTYSKIGGLTNSESEYSYDSEDELGNLIQYSKEAGVKLTKNSITDQDSLPNLIIYATPKGRIVHLEKSGLNNRSTGISDPQVDELPF